MVKFGNIKSSGNTLLLSSQATGKNKKSTVSECIITTILKRKEAMVFCTYKHHTRRKCIENHILLQKQDVTIKGI